MSLVARPSTLTLLTPSAGSGQGLSVGDSFVADAGPAASDLTVIWRSCRGLNRLTVTETATTVIVDVEVSGCPAGYQGAKEPPPSGAVWFGGVVRLAHPLAGRRVISSHGVFCDVVIR